MSATDPLLSVEDIHTYYGSSYVLQGISLSVGHGEVVAVLGRNGVGKTTLIRSIVAFTPPRRGSIRFAGQELADVSAFRIVRAGIGIVPQGRRVFGTLTVRETLAISARASVAKQRRWTVDSVLDLFPRLAERLDNRGATLSGGEQQMLAIARGLLCDPTLLLMDEPTEGLSPFMVEEVRKLILLLKSLGTSVLLVEQNLQLALATADYLHVVDKGQVVYSAKPSDLDTGSEVAALYLGI